LLIKLPLGIFHINPVTSP